MASVGTIIDNKYRLTRVLGEGGMGAVYAAENIGTGKRVAIKTLRADLAQNKDLLARFFQEARSATQIEHANIVEVFDLDIDSVSGEPYIVQELLRGVSLKQHTDAQPDKRLHPSEALDLLVPIMGALVAAHRRGIVHRDLKPENIFLARNSSGMIVPKLIDFGISKVMNADKPVDYRTQGGVPFGTPAYMSPEQTLGEETIDGQADVWSIGVVLYEALTGRLPFEAPNQNALVVKITTDEPTPIESFVPEIPADLASVIHRAIIRDREQRFANMKSFLAALLECTSYLGPATASGLFEAAQKLPSGRHAAVTARSSAAPPLFINAGNLDELHPPFVDDEHPTNEPEEVTTERPAIGERDSDQDATTLKFSRQSLQAPLLVQPMNAPELSAPAVPAPPWEPPPPPAATSPTQVAWEASGRGARNGRIALFVLTALVMGAVVFSVVRFRGALWASLRNDPQPPRRAAHDRRPAPVVLVRADVAPVDAGVAVVTSDVPVRDANATELDAFAAVTADVPGDGPAAPTDAGAALTPEDATAPARGARPRRRRTTRHREPSVTSARESDRLAP
jgi:serine/threonine protein kinase